jgi:hypothetical protein
MKAKITAMRRFVPLALLMAGPSMAGPLDPPAGPPASTMVTLQQVYDALKPPGCFNNNPSGFDSSIVETARCRTYRRS